MTISKSKVLDALDTDDTLYVTGTAPVTITIPLNRTVAFRIGTVIYFSQDGTGAVNFVPVAGVTLQSEGNMRTIAAQYVMCFLQKKGSDTWQLVGKLK